MDKSNKNQPTNNHFYSGGWNTNSEEKFAKIIATPLDESRLFLISAVELVDTKILKFNIHVDGKIIPISFHEGSNVLIEGKSITIEQLNEGNHFSSRWQEIQADLVSFDSYPWEVDLSEGIVEPVLIASFETEREFVLHFNRASSNHINLASLELIIDGKSVRRDENGNPLAIFLEGNSIIGKGKIISVMVSKKDTNNTKKFSGSINLLQKNNSISHLESL